MEKILFDTFMSSYKMPKSILRDDNIFESRLNLYEDKYGTETKYKTFEDCVNRHGGGRNFIKEGIRLNGVFNEIGGNVHNKVQEYIEAISPGEEYFHKIPLGYIPEHDYIEIDMCNCGFELYRHLDALKDEYGDIINNFGFDEFFLGKHFRQKFHFNHVFCNLSSREVNMECRQILSDKDSPIIQFLEKHDIIEKAMQKCDALFFDITGFVDEIKDYFGKDISIGGHICHIRHHKISEHHFLDTNGNLHSMLLTTSPYWDKYESNMEDSVWYPQMHRLMKGETVTEADRAFYKDSEIVLLPELTKIDNDMLLN